MADRMRLLSLRKKGGPLRKGRVAMGHSRKRLDLTGQRFGKLTVLAPAESIGGHTAWLCQCDCGNKAVVKTYHLRDGHTSSCGCLKKAVYASGTSIGMLRAKTVRKNNTSGVPGVDWRPTKGMWRAAICFKGQRYYLGSFERFEDAVAARKAAEYRLHDQFVEQFSDPKEIQ